MSKNEKSTSNSIIINETEINKTDLTDNTNTKTQCTDVTDAVSPYLLKKGAQTPTFTEDATQHGATTPETDGTEDTGTTISDS